MIPSTSRRGSRAPLAPFGPLSTVRYAVNGVRFDMVRVPPGRFVDGAGFARRELLVSCPFEIGVTPVTQALWRAVMGSSPSRFPGEDRPVEMISWGDVQKFVGALAARGFPGFRLPTEAEWAWAARCGAPTRWAGADRVKSVAVVDARQAAPVASLSGAAAGALDFSGNVWEWVDDWFSHAPSAGVDVQVLVLGSDRVVRGGSWSYSSAYARVAARLNDNPNNRYNFIGVRLAKDVP